MLQVASSVPEDRCTGPYLGALGRHAPVARLYNALGFWPAVLIFPALGLFGITTMARKLRAVNATRSMITGPQ